MPYQFSSPLSYQQFIPKLEIQLEPRPNFQFWDIGSCNFHYIPISFVSDVYGSYFEVNELLFCMTKLIRWKFMVNYVEISQYLILLVFDVASFEFKIQIYFVCIEFFRNWLLNFFMILSLKSWLKQTFPNYF